MSDLVTRILARSHAASGIQPRIAPSTAPDPWRGPVELELAEVEVLGSARGSDLAAPLESGARVSERAATRTHAATQREQPVPLREPDERDLDSRRSSPLHASAELTTDARNREPPPIADLRSARPASTDSLALSHPPPASPRLDEFDELDERVAVAEAREPSPVALPGREPSLRARTTGVMPRARSSHDAAALELHDRFVVSTGSDAQRGEGTSTAHGTAPLDVPDAFEAQAPQLRTPRSAAASPARARDPLHDLPRPPRRGAESEPVVRVEIGRVELRASPPPEPPRRERGIPKPDAFVSLKQYLRDRGGS